MGAYALPELNAMQQIAILIQDLSTQERKRVAAWLMEYASQNQTALTETSITQQPSTMDYVTSASEADAVDVDSEEDEGYAALEESEQQEEKQDLSTFDAFFEAAAPKKGAQKAAVAAYWLESKQGLGTWKAFDVNKLLKSIGVKVSSISIVLSNAVKAANPLFTESDRMGDGERARKTFHLSEAGIAYVESLIA